MQPNASVSALRHVADLCQLHKDDCIIKYRPQNSAFMNLGRLDQTETHKIDSVYIYTTAIPQGQTSHSHSLDGEDEQSSGYISWLHAAVNPTKQKFVDKLKSSNRDTREQLDRPTPHNNSRDSDKLALGLCTFC